MNDSVVLAAANLRDASPQRTYSISSTPFHVYSMVQSRPAGFTTHQKFINEAEDDIPIKATFDHGNRLTDAGFAWTEYRGECGPPADMGRTGDVWMNTKLGSMAIYWNSKGKWTPWAGLDRTEGNSASSSHWILTPNPIIPTLFLWVRVGGAVWLHRSAIIADISKGNQPDNGYRRMSPLPVHAALFVSDFLTSAAARKAEKNREWSSSSTVDSGSRAEKQQSVGNAISTPAPTRWPKLKV